MFDIVAGSGKAPAKYNPARGLVEIAVHEAEKHFRRARNAEELLKAVEAKIRAQAAYVAWRDGVVVPSRVTGSSGVKGRRRVSGLKADLPDADPGNLTTHRWRKLYCDTGKAGTVVDRQKLAVAIDEAQQRCLRFCEKSDAYTKAGFTREFELYTAAVYVEAARAVLGNIDLDPATNARAQSTVRADRTYTQREDGLAHDWHGRVWLNPPYSVELLPKFVDKMIEQVQAGNTKSAVMLTNNCTDTAWFARALTAATAVCFTTGRIKFLRAGGAEVAPTQGQAFFYYGTRVARFAKVFSRFGLIMSPWTS